MSKSNVSPETPKNSEDRKFDLHMAEIVWKKCKGYDIPECFSEEDRVSILDRYWHRAMNHEDLPDE